MQQIQRTIKQLTQYTNVHSYQNCITYLTNLIQIISQNDSNAVQVAVNQLQNKDYNQSTHLSQKKQDSFQNSQQQANANRDHTNEHNDMSELNDSNSNIQTTQKYEGKSINLIQNGVASKKYKLNKKQLQQTIQIYHQCLNEAIILICKIYPQIPANFTKYPFQNTKITNKIIYNLSEFWKNYSQVFYNAKSFDELIQISHQTLAKQFRQVLSIFQISRQDIAKFVNSSSKIEYYLA